jgi:hypothetical protein
MFDVPRERMFNIQCSMFNSQDGRQARNTFSPGTRTDGGIEQKPTINLKNISAGLFHFTFSPQPEDLLLAEGGEPLKTS